MTQSELWKEHYTSIMSFMKDNKRRPSKHRKEERKMVNWIKYNKKSFAKGSMEASRAMKFQKLLDLASQYQRVNQYQYVATEPADETAGYQEEA